MNLTPHHARYFTHDLTRRATSGMDRLSMALFDTAVDRNPHQIDAALFALQSPLSTGVILADDVGRLIVEHEQGGRARAAYGEAVLADLSRRLTAEFGRGFDPSNLRYMRFS